MNATFACPGLASLRAYLLGRMSEAPAAAVEAHLAACAECRKLLPTVQAEDDLVADFRTQAGRPEPDSALLDRLAADLRGRLLPPEATTPAAAPAAEGVAGAPTLPEPPRESEELHLLCTLLAPPQQPDEIGRLGGYRILKELGRGGMGVVFQAEDVRLKRRVAVKAMLPALAANPKAAQRFLREAQAMAAVEHDHIVRIYQVGEDRGVPFLAMEFLKGEPLDERLKREGKGEATSPLPVAEVLRIGREIAEGLAAAHANGLTHRDIKPGNVWLEGDRARVKILDFGLVRMASDNNEPTPPGSHMPMFTDNAQLTQAGAIVGTPQFMAPEQAEGKPVDARCDLFSLGCVLYRMFTGRMAFTGSTTTGILMSILRQQPKPPRELNPELPPAVNDLVLRLLAKSVDDRPASAHAVVKAIKAIEWELARVQAVQVTAPASPTPQTFTESRGNANGAAAGPSVPPPPVPTQGVSSRRRWLLTAAAACLFAVVCLAAVLTFQTKNGTLVVKVTESDVQVLVDGEKNLVIDSKKVGRVELIPGEHKLIVKRGEEELFTDSFSLKSGGEVVIDAKWTPKPQQVVHGVDEARPMAVVTQVIDREYELKAAYLYNFGKYVEWPKNAIPGNDDTFVIGVIGHDPFDQLLDGIASAKTLQDKKIVIRRFASAKDYQPCHILFVAAGADVGAEEKTVEDRMKAVKAKIEGAPVLLVGDTPSLALMGAMINSLIDDNKITLGINNSAATQAGLKISSQLVVLHGGFMIVPK